MEAVIDDLAAASRHHARQIEMCQVHHGLAIQTHHVELPLQVARPKLAVSSHAGVVHQKIDCQPLALGERVHRRRTSGIGQVRTTNLHGNAMPLR